MEHEQRDNGVLAELPADLRRPVEDAIRRSNEANQERLDQTIEQAMQRLPMIGRWVMRLRLGKRSTRRDTA